MERSNNFWEDDHYELAVWPSEIGNGASHLWCEIRNWISSSSLVLERLTVKPPSLEGERS